MSGELFFVKAAYLSPPDCVKHDMGAFHPERPARLDAIERHLRAAGLLARVLRPEIPEVTRAALERVHTVDLIDRIERLAPVSGTVAIDPDTHMNRHSLRAARLAAGALVKAVDLAVSGVANRSFCNVRPPGHHAERTRAMGFCLFNNVAVGAAHALAAHGLKRIAIIDFDVHHGNGSEDIFKDDARIMLCSSFQQPFYPGSSLDRIGSNPHIIKSPLSVGEGGAEFRALVSGSWLPALKKFAPELVFFSAGFDAHADDPLAGLNFREDDYAWVTRQVIAATGESAVGRFISTLEGGYDLPALGRSAVAHVGELFNNRDC